MQLLGIRAFAQKVSRHVDDVERTGKPVVLTRHGKPVAAVIPLKADEFEDFVLSYAPEFTGGMDASGGEVGRGETRPLDEVLEEIDRDEAKAREADAPDRSGSTPGAR